MDQSKGAMEDLILQDFGKHNSVNIASLTVSEIRDIILGQEIAAPSVQRQQMAKLEKSAEAQNQVTAVQTSVITFSWMCVYLRILTVKPRMYMVTLSKPSPQSIMNSKPLAVNLIGVRAISATHLALGLQHIYISNDDIKDDAGSFTYVVPENILRAFITTFDLRTQVAAFLYGVSPLDKQVEEIKAIA